MIINAYATHREPPPLEFPHDLGGRRDRSDPELVPHLQDFMGFVMDGGKRQMSAMRYGVLRHIERVHHHLSFEIDGETPAVAAWARAANAILFHEDGSVRAPDGKVLVDPTTGDPEPDAELPYPADAVARKATVDKQLAERGIPVMPTLPPCISEVEAELRAPREVASRILALFVCAARAEGLAHGEPLPVEMMRKRMPLGFAALTPKEKAYMASAAPAQQTLVNQIWRYEAIYALAWAVHLVDSIPFPDAICDVNGLGNKIFALNADKFVASARLRPTSEILDLLDVTFRLHWAAAEARMAERELPGVEAGAVVERHYALNWLTRFADADWDDVDTPT